MKFPDAFVSQPMFAHRTVHFPLHPVLEAMLVINMTTIGDHEPLTKYVEANCTCCHCLCSVRLLFALSEVTAPRAFEVILLLNTLSNS